VGVTIVNAPNGDASGTPTGTDAVPAGTPGDPNNALVKPVGPNNAVLPPVDKPAEAPDQVNGIKPGTAQQQTAADAARKKSKAKLDDESSSKKKKKKGLGKLNPF
jgi:outer membrane protein assembly factor BamD